MQDRPHLPVSNDDPEMALLKLAIRGAAFYFSANPAPGYWNDCRREMSPSSYCLPVNYLATSVDECYSKEQQLKGCLLNAAVRT